MSSATRNKSRNLLIINFRGNIFRLSLSDHLSFVYLQKVFDVEIDEENGSVGIIPLNMRTLEREYYNVEVLDLWELP